ncbi:MAG: polysaccharide deacetylase family protein [Clostridia bacterium]|nr:polysaccharide deacetylase family protein [Clostridia bacterium]
MKIFVITKKTGILLILCAVLMTSLFYIGRNETLTVSSAKRDLPIYCVQMPENEKVVALSFDAAWGNEDTGQLIKIMDKYNVKTTFFVVGSWVDKYPESVKQLSDAGHEIMNHSNSHPHMTQISVEKMKEEATKCDEKIKAITGVQPTLFRAPYGDYNNDVVGAMRETGHFTIQWDVDSLDWKNLTASEITDRVLKKVKPGSIVLFHNAALHTPEALPAIIESLQKDGYKIVPVSEIILKENFTIDNSGMQIPDKAEPNSAAPAKVESGTETEKKTEQKAQPTSAPTDIII